MSTATFEPKGVIPACLLPFHADLGIDEKSYRSHLLDVAGVRGLSAITINAHATEVASCAFEEQRRILQLLRCDLGQGFLFSPALPSAQLEAFAAQARAATPRPSHPS